MGSGQVALLWKPSCRSTEPRPTQEQQEEEPDEEVGDARQEDLMHWAPLQERSGLNQASPWAVLGQRCRLGGGLRRVAGSSRNVVGLLAPFSTLVVVLA
jgi:hypothetical protein